MKNKSQTTMYIVLVLMILIVVVCNMYIASPKKEAIEKLEASNAELQARVDSIKQYYDEREEYKKQIATMTENIKAKLAPYPADSWAEDAMVLAYDMGYKQPTETFDRFVYWKNVIPGAQEEISKIEQADVKRANIEGLESEIVFRQRSTEYGQYTTYEDLHKIIETINSRKSSDDNVAIREVKYEYDDNNQMLDGMILVDFYSVQGTGKTYVPKVLPSYEAGATDLFSSVESKKNQ